MAKIRSSKHTRTIDPHQHEWMEWDNDGLLVNEDGEPLMCSGCGCQWRVPTVDERGRWKGSQESRLNMVCSGCGCRKVSMMITLMPSQHTGPYKRARTKG